MPDAPMNRLLNLKVAKDRKGMAPNKPLLLLATMDLVEAGLVGAEGLVHKDAQLNLRFRSYSPICVPRRGNAVDLGLPFLDWEAGRGKANTFNFGVEKARAIIAMKRKVAEFAAAYG